MLNKPLLRSFILFAVLSSGCMSVVIYDGPYRGRAVEAISKEPIEGAVILGTWYIRHHNLGGGYGEFYDAQEVKTDKDGKFTLKGQGLRIMSNLEPVNILVFKAGYSYDEGPWGAFKHPKRADKYKWDKDMLIIPLKVLTLDVRKSDYAPNRPSIPIEKMKLMTDEINKDRTACGLNTL